MNTYDLQASRAGQLMGDPVELGSNTGIVASITGAVSLAIGWGINLMLKKMGITAATVGESNSQAQKDMLDWQRDQLKAEVERREKAEALNQELTKKISEFIISMGRLEAQNQRLQDQVQELTTTLDEVKASLART